jgi:hypothetical protein
MSLEGEIMKIEFAVCVGGTPGNGYLTFPSDEDDSSDLISVTEDPELVARFETADLAQVWLDKLVVANPNREFRITPIAPLHVADDWTLMTPDELVRIKETGTGDLFWLFCPWMIAPSLGWYESREEGVGPDAFALASGGHVCASDVTHVKKIVPPGLPSAQPIALS